MDNIFFDLKQLKYLGEGAIIGKTVRIRKPEKTIIGDHTIIDDFTYISCELEVGRYCHISSNVSFIGSTGKVTMGDFVGIASGCSIHAGSSNFITASLDLSPIPLEFQFGTIVEKVYFENFILLGSHTVVLPGVHLPEGFASSAHTVIRKYKYEPWTLYGGFECRKLSKRSNNKFLKKIKEMENKIKSQRKK